MTTRMRKTGEFCWFNLMSPQTDQARGFFGELFGWTYSEIPNVGHTIALHGHKIGGFFDAIMPNGQKMAPVIGVMIKVDNADAAAEKARSLGGTARAPWDVFGNLRMSVVTDPSGASFDLWESKKESGFDVSGERHGAPVWIELVTNDVPRAVKFYGGLFGWTTETMQSPGMEYTIFKLGDLGVGGCFAIRPEMGAMPPQWVTYFTVDDADAVAKKTERLGGKICMPPSTIDGVGRLAALTSPQGVNFSIIKPMPR